ncbi:hypothetical protein ACFVOR_01750 [Streptomyces sp. NPDC057837]|uniref:hypothetical protein n=1 Tax=Streptomyces sp. NPDC057837 TaxID=3346260 RepID=UPI0036C119FF
MHSAHPQRGDDPAASSTRAGQAPAGEAPVDRPDGTLGNRSSADNGTSRHGDTHAVASSHRVPLRLVPGTAVRGEAGGTRDSHGDVPVFPG